MTISFHPMLLELFSTGHMMWIFLAVIVLFGGRKIPELARGLGKGIREFNDAKEGVKNEIQNGARVNNTTTTTTTTPVETRSTVIETPANTQ